MTETAPAPAQRERQIRITKADIEEIKGICLSAFKSTHILGYSPDLLTCEIIETRLTRGGLILRGTISRKTSITVHRFDRDARKAMRTALTNLGYLVTKDFGEDGVIVTGWDPHYYEGAQLTPERIDTRINELLEIRREVVELMDADED